MDVDFWTTKINSAKNLSAVQCTHLSNSVSHLNEENEAEDVRAWFPCPFCYVDIEVPTLCSHLQDEHCFELTDAVYPICAATLGKDPTRHFSFQHAHSVKRRRRNYLKPGFWNNDTAMIGKDPIKITSLLAKNSEFSQYIIQEYAPDPLLLPFLCNAPPSDPKCRQHDKSSVCDTATTETESLNFLADPCRDFSAFRVKIRRYQSLLLT
ncbi:unnamed protein product [Withania somnifera]